MPDIGNSEVVLLGPEEGDRVERLRGGRACCARPSGPGARRRRNARRGSLRRCADPASARCRRPRTHAGALVSRNWSTSTPRSMVRPACSASAVAGRTPIPTTTRSASIRSPLSSVTACSSIETAVRPRWKLTPCSSWTERMNDPSSGPSTRAIGIASGPMTWISRPRALSDEATSRPMKLAPMITALRAFSAFAISARLSPSVRR